MWPIFETQGHRAQLLIFLNFIGDTKKVVTVNFRNGAQIKYKTNHQEDFPISLNSSFGFSLFGVATAPKYFPFLQMDFVSFISSNPFHVVSCLIHLPSPWPFSFPSTWHHHLHHPFFPRSLLSFSHGHTSIALHSEVCPLAL